MDTRIYVMTHKQIEPLPYEGYELLQLGAAIKDDLGYIRDDTGDNISAKNPNYCELTGIYWLWKNIKCDNIGVVHYRRFFYSEKNDFITVSDVERYLEEYDAILPASGFGDLGDMSGGYPDTLYDHYARHHFAKDLDLCRTVMEEKYPEYVRAFDAAVKGGYLISFANIWITRKETFDRYCEWLFDILFEVEKRTDISGYDNYQARIFGFLSERLFRVWLLLQPMRNMEVDAKQIDCSEVAADAKENDLITRLMELKLAPLFNFYAGTPGASLILPHDPKDDFEGKMPVWVCWWQGEKDMPELISTCYENIKKNLPADRTVIRFITEQNVLRYATFTEGLIAKYQQGKIDVIHMTDIMRSELLYRYGGMWIDLSYYVSKPIPAEFFDAELFTMKFPDDILWRRDVGRGRWSYNLWVAKKEHPFFKYLTEALWFYFEADETPISYYAVDFIIRVLYGRYPEIKNVLDEIPVTGEHCFDLQKILCKRVTRERIDSLRENGLFYKLNRRVPCSKQVITEEETMYGWMVRQCT